MSSRQPFQLPSTPIQPGITLIEADNLDFAGKLQCDGQAHVPEADNGQLGLLVN